MDSKILFEEKQCFGNKSGRNFFYTLTAFFLISILIRFFIKGQVESDTLIAIFITGFLITALISIFLTNCLITQITIEGIFVSFPPFMPGKKMYLWKNIREVTVIRYRPITKYGGWGIRIGPYGRAYNITSDTGLQILFWDNSKLLIGTRQPEELTIILRKLGKIK